MSTGSSPQAPIWVVKLGGEVIASEALTVLAADLAKLPQIVLVHGGGAQISALQRALGQESSIIGGYRVTDDATLEVFKMVVAGKLNVDLCAALLAAGGNPVGLHGASSLAVRATRTPAREVEGHGLVDFGHVGDVASVNHALLSTLLDGGFTPVLACVGADERGAIYNINADTAARGVATALGAAGVLLISDVPGVLRDLHDPQSRIAKLTRTEAEAAIADGSISRGMVPKLRESFDALAAGVPQVFILGRLGPGDLLRAVAEPGSVGTVLVPD